MRPGQSCPDKKKTPLYIYTIVRYWREFEKILFSFSLINFHYFLIIWTPTLSTILLSIIWYPYCWRVSAFRIGYSLILKKKLLLYFTLLCNMAGSQTQTLRYSYEEVDYVHVQWIEKYNGYPCTLRQEQQVDILVQINDNQQVDIPWKQPKKEEIIPLPLMDYKKRIMAISLSELNVTMDSDIDISDLLSNDDDSNIDLLDTINPKSISANHNLDIMCDTKEIKYKKAPNKKYNSKKVKLKRQRPKTARPKTTRCLSKPKVRTRPQSAKDHNAKAFKTAMS